MSKIGNRPPGSSPPPTDLQTPEGAQKFREAAKQANVPTRVADVFESSAGIINQQLQTMATRATSQLKFSSQAMAQLAGLFAAVIRQYPRATRRERAKLFAKTILRHRKLGKIFEDANEEDIEEMFDTIADQLDNSPILAQLVDDVTESARKINLG